jgi:hypothetical protein
VIQVPVEGDFPCRGIKCPCILFDGGRIKIADKSPKARNNDTVMAEQQLPYVSFYVQENTLSYITKIRLFRLSFREIYIDVINILLRIRCS